MTTARHTISSDEFLRLRKNLANNEDLLEKFDDQIRDLCATQPDDATRIFDTLAQSDSVDDREYVAIYVRHLLAYRYDVATALLKALLHDPNQDVRQKAEDAITAAAEANEINVIDAARLYDT